MELGIDVFLSDPNLRSSLKGKRVALLGHPASMTHPLNPMGYLHSLDAISELKDINLTSAFGPQHGMRGEKQDNMIETEDYIDPAHGIPVFSLYGEVRKPTEKMLSSFDVILIDLQDVGTRIYTYLTTLSYILESCTSLKKSAWVLDRPNPAGRVVEGTLLRSGWESFVGCDQFPMRHGLTLGECALWLKKKRHLAVDLRVIAMKDYDPTVGPGFGWPSDEVSWVNPSPNASTLAMARCFPGTVMLEGTNLSEGRGTTKSLEVVGAPDLKIHEILSIMEDMAPQWLQGCLLRPCFFQPTFHKHNGKMCSGFQIHVDHAKYDPVLFKPYRLLSLFFKALRKWAPSYEIWRDFHYEYEKDRLAIDLINGSPLLREWVDDKNGTVADFEKINIADERAWIEERREHLLYPV